MYGSLTCQRKGKKHFARKTISRLNRLLFWKKRWTRNRAPTTNAVIAYYCNDAFRPTNSIPEYMCMWILNCASQHSYIIISGSKAAIIHVTRILYWIPCHRTMNTTKDQPSIILQDICTQGHSILVDLSWQNEFDSIVVGSPFSTCFALLTKF